MLSPEYKMKNIVSHIRKEFPILSQHIHGHPLVYFDNAATTQKPLQVIQASTKYYSRYNSNVHRGVHFLSSHATMLHEETREKTATFLNCHKDEIVFTSGTTQGINLIAHSLLWNKGDEVILTEMEHHSNILPWQILKERFGIQLKILPLNEKLRPQWELLKEYITEKTKLVSFTHLSNTIGCLTPAEDIIQQIRSYAPHVLILLDGAQSVPHSVIHLDHIQPDFFVFSMHKVYGPTGVGILYIRKNVYDKLHPAFTGGGTIKQVDWEKTEYETGPVRFEPGTPNLEGVYATGYALEFIQHIGMSEIHAHEKNLTNHALERLQEINEVELYSRGEDICSVISFNVKGVHPYDVGTLLDQYGIAVRTGHHCTQPLMKRLGISGTVRISFALYNTPEEVDYFIEKLKKIILMLK